METVEEILSSLIVELKRGTIVLSVLSQLKKPKYGYSLVQILEDKDALVEANTLYPLLRRLEKQELLISKWDVEESRPRKYYVLSEKGEIVYKRLKNEWEIISSKVNKLLKEEDNYESN